MTSELLRRILNRLLKGSYILIPKNKDGVVKNGIFSPCDSSLHAVVDKGKNLILEKGKYKISLRERREIGQDDPVGMLVIDNSRKAYDMFWGSEKTINDYLCNARMDFFNEIFLNCKKYFQGKIIDIGCGSGDLLKIIKASNMNCSLYGMDFSSSAIQRCQSQIPDAQFNTGDIYRMHYGDNIFDVVLCIEVFEHLEAPDIALNEVRKICKSSGTIIITVPNGIFDDYIGHLNFWSESEFKKLIKEEELLDFRYLDDRRTMLFVLKNR